MSTTLCNQIGHDSNAWQVNVSIGYSLPGNDAAEKSAIGWTLENQPLPMAHTLVQASVQILNSGLFQVYAQLLAECGEEQAAIKLRALVDNIGM